MNEASSASPTPFAAIIVAAGKGERAGQGIPKQFSPWRGKPLLRHSVERLLAQGAHPLLIAIPADGENDATTCLRGLTGFGLVTGGDTRQASVRNALEQVARDHPATQLVLIHDAARPDCPADVTARLVAALATHDGAIPVLPVVDSLAVAQGDVMTGSAEREQLRRVQTPQAFRFGPILAAHRAWSGDAGAGDDAQVFLANGGTVCLVAGDERLHKVTFSEDFVMDIPMIRTGLGYDVHRLVAGEELWLGGIKIDHDKGLSGHSDADVALHAIVDALLGAVGDGDIGSHFPPSDPQWKGADSSRFVEHARSIMASHGYALSNCDLTIICEAPKIGPHRQAMRDRIAGLLGVQTDRISVKATTTERLGFTGRGEGIAAQAIVTVIKDPSG